MKRFWNYLFYFTWKLHNIFWHNYVKKPLNYLFGLSKFGDGYNKKGERAISNLSEDISYNLTIRFSFECMRITSVMLFLSVEIFIFFSLDTNLSEILNFLFGITISHKFNTMAFFISSMVIFPYIFNEILLGFYKEHYIQYFKEFEKDKKNKVGYVISIVSHLGAAILLMALILYFDI